MTSRTRLELLAAAGGLALWSYVAWDGALWDARFQLVLHAGAAVALAALLVMALRGLELPRTPLELPILTLLAAFGVATLFAQNSGMSLRSLAVIVTAAALLPLALVLIRHRPALTAMLAAVPIILLSAGALGVMLVRRAEWVAAGGPGLPPFRLPAEGTPFGSVAVPPFVLLAALPLTVHIAEPRVRRWIQLALLVVGIPLTLLSGSRSAWLAVGVAVLVFAAPAIRRIRLPRHWDARSVAIGALALAGTAAALAIIAPRLTAVTSLIYRGYLWRDTLAAWSASPITGIGPGIMPWARQAAAPPLSFPVRQPHSHDIALGILGDAGVIGLAAALVVFATFVVVAGPWRTRTIAGRGAFAVLVGFAVASFFEDLTFLPGFNLLVLLLAAQALTDAGAVSWQRLRLGRSLAVAGAAGASALLLVGLIVDGAAIDYRFGADASANRDWPAAQRWFSEAVALDPWHPSGPKSLSVAADMAGDDVTARQAAERATELNTGDGPSWTNLAILCLEDGDHACASRAAHQAVDYASLFGNELANAALVLDRLGETDAADAAYRLSLLTNVGTSFVVPWPRSVDVGTALPVEIGVTAGETNLAVARRALGLPIDPSRYQDAAARALAAAMAGDRPAAELALERARDVDREIATTWDVELLLRTHWSEPVDRVRAIDTALRGKAITDQPPEVDGLTYDIASFRIYPRDGLVGPAVRLITRRPWPWFLEPLLPPA
jgi:O-antigen ligase/Flp pilus assembly protein TadD